MSHPSGTSTTGSNKKHDNHYHNSSLDETQLLINAALDSALDELDSDHDDDEENETFSDCISNEHEIHSLQNEEEKLPQQQRPPNQYKKNTTGTIDTCSNGRPMQGPPKPPVTSSTSSSNDVNNNMDQLFTSMMEQLMNMNHTDSDIGGSSTGDGGGGTTSNDTGHTTNTDANIDPFIADLMSKNINDDEVLLGKFMQEIQTRLQSELFHTMNNNNHNMTTDTESSSPLPLLPPPPPPNHQQQHETQPHSSKNKTTTSTTTPKMKTPVSQPPLTTESNVTTGSSSYNNNSNISNSSEVESVISNLVSNLSQTMNRHMNNEDDNDDDISELDDLPDMDDVIRNTVEDDDQMAVLLQKLMRNLMNHPTNADTATTPNNNSNNHNNNPDQNVVTADTILDGMMEQLLCKDIMYEPMKQVASKFPTWLQQQQSVLSATEYERRCQQNECFQKIVQIYEIEPIDMKQLIGLMQEVQEYGQPPSDIIQAIAPGIELDDNGIPTMNPTTSTTFPPFGTNKDEDCRIM